MIQSIRIFFASGIFFASAHCSILQTSLSLRRSPQCCWDAKSLRRNSKFMAESGISF